MKSVLKYVIILTIAIMPALGCGEKVTKIDPVKAEQSNQTQKRWCNKSVACEW